MKIIKRLTKGEAIRARCLDCCNHQLSEVRLCPATDCPLFPYRMGREDITVYSDEIRLQIEEDRRKKAEKRLSSVKNEEERGTDKC